MSEYVIGESSARNDFASFEFKAHWSEGSGGGYPRWRSWEFDESLGRKKDVYVSVHRLCALAWLFPDDQTAEEILETGVFHPNRVDVHHELEHPSCNIEDELELLEHGSHSEITNAQVRAWAEDARRRVEESDGHQTSGEAGCGRCGATAETLTASPDWGDEYRCLECAMETGSSEPIEVV